MPPEGAEDIATVGGVKYPPPLSPMVIYLIAPEVTIPVIAVAVDPVPIRVRVCVIPCIVLIPSSVRPSPTSSPTKLSSISSTPVAMTSSSILNSSQVSSYVYKSCN